MTKNNRYTKKELVHIFACCNAKVATHDNNTMTIVCEKNSREAMLFNLTGKYPGVIKKIDLLMKKIDDEGQALRHQVENLKHADDSLKPVVSKAIDKRVHKIHAMLKKLATLINKCSY